MTTHKPNYAQILKDMIDSGEIADSLSFIALNTRRGADEDGKPVYQDCIPPPTESKNK